MSTFSFFTSDIITFLVSEITYLKKHAFKSQKSLIHIVLKIGKFSALDSYDVGTIIKFWTSFFCHIKKNTLHHALLKLSHMNIIMFLILC
jgi:hypothetical protein